MVYPESTEEQPLNFFTEVFLKGELEELKKSFFREWKHTKDDVDNNITISIEDEYVIHYFNSDEYNSSLPTKITFTDALKELVIKQKEVSSKLIKRGIGTLRLANRSLTIFLVEQSKILRTLSELDNIFLLDAVNHLNTLVKELIVSDVLGNEYVQRLGTIDFYDDRLFKILEVLGYLNGTGINQQKIMPDPDYRRLLFYTIQMIQNKSAPHIDIPFKRLIIPNELLRYTYYVLHVELYGVKPRRKYFTEFLEDVFLQMKDIDSLYDKFAQKPRTIPEYVSADIIKLHFGRKKK